MSGLLALWLCPMVMKLIDTIPMEPTTPDTESRSSSNVGKSAAITHGKGTAQYTSAKLQPDVHKLVHPIFQPISEKSTSSTRPNQSRSGDASPVHPMIYTHDTFHT
ncbi:uncharacterized protein BDZ83DRAFT_207800 [Colletotrichum acutatum]|uniref:Uncharacterized protein n=1 Tax=Glomerella acutata TaxID=27357 RepID=A0AAD8XB96_GLOAC|nr:uncharacterized protein BDZ83DRAFT_207800 [Colletotrichum acutatum]KAK1705616.1 hypothetical protein BDZ83DRAFT_207800 [Colletotrichum acutatum]